MIRPKGTMRFERWTLLLTQTSISFLPHVEISHGCNRLARDTEEKPERQVTNDAVWVA